jgi:TM2 domain-containing membrane protein YozV
MSANVSASQPSVVSSQKSAVLALFLCLLFGWLGAHRFYVGKTKSAICMLITLGGFGVWTLVDLVLIACSEFKDSEGRLLLFVRPGDSSLKTILGIVTLLIGTIVIYGAMVAIIILVVVGGVSDVVHTQLAAIRAGDYQLAYSYTSPEFQEKTSYDEFAAFIEHIPALKNNVDATLFTSKQVKDGQADLLGTVTGKDGVATPIEYLLIKEDNVWKVLAIRVNPDHPASSESENDKDNTPDPATSATPKEIAKPLTFDDKAGRYSLQYPSTWYYEQPDAASIMFSGKSGSPSYYSTVTIQRLPMKKTGGIYTSVQDVIKDLKNQINEKTTNVKFAESGVAVLAKDPKKYTGEYFVVTYTYKKHIMKKMQYVIMQPDGSAAYSWGYTAPADSFNYDLPIAKSIYDSWVIH